MRQIAFVFLVISASLFGTSAEAKRGLAVVNYGDEIFDLGPLLPAKPDVRVGRICRHVGLFWADIATWDCRIVLADQDLSRYGELPAGMKAAIEAEYANATPDRGFWNRYGAFVMLGLVGFAMLRKLTRNASSGPEPVRNHDADGPIPSQPGNPPPARMAAATGGARGGFGRRGVS